MFRILFGPEVPSTLNLNSSKPLHPKAYNLFGAWRAVEIDSAVDNAAISCCSLRGAGPGVVDRMVLGTFRRGSPWWEL